MVGGSPNHRVIAGDESWSDILHPGNGTLPRGVPGYRCLIQLLPQNSMSFLGIGKSINPMEQGNGPQHRPLPMRLMSFQLAIPQRVALQQCPPPLHQLGLSLLSGQFPRQYTLTKPTSL